MLRSGNRPPFAAQRLTQQSVSAPSWVLGAGPLMPDIKTDGPHRAVCVGSEEMAARMEVTMDEGVSRKEGLRPLQRLEPLHLPFSAP